MKSLKRILVIMLIVTQFTGLFSNVNYGIESNKAVVSNGFVQYSVNVDNGRFSIATNKGAAYRSDEDQPLLFEEYTPDTSFSTFRIDGKDYIYGNDYGFMNMDSFFEQKPVSTGLVNESIWVVNGVLITQTITLDQSVENAGNVKISYKVNNNSGKEIDLGSRILLDTMLGVNDGAPLALVGGNTFIENEKRLIDDEVPTYWKAVDHKEFSNVVSFGLTEGWRDGGETAVKGDLYNAKPNEMVIGHWEGLSKSKWDYTIDPSLNFASINNKYKSSDSAVALYWNEGALEAGGERVYETYYGIGQFSTQESEVPVTFDVYSPERLYLNNDKTGYNMDVVTIKGQIDNRFVNSQKLINVKATIEVQSTGLNLPFGAAKTLELGNIGVNDLKDFSWDLTTSPLYSWNQFRYRIKLTADNLTQPMTRDGDILIPPISGKPPIIKITNCLPSKLYNLDEEKIITITGESLNSIAYGGNYRVVISSIKDGNEYAIESTNIVCNPSSMEVNIPKSLDFSTVGDYNVRLEYVEDGKPTVFNFPNVLGITTDTQYMTRTYGILMVIREKVYGTSYYDYDYKYKLVHGKSEEDIKKLGDYEKLILDIRADKIVKVGDTYTIPSEEITINSVVTCKRQLVLGYDPMVIKKMDQDIYHEDDYIYITGMGNLSLADMQFHMGPYEITIEDGPFYSVSGEDDESEVEDVAIDIPTTYKGFPNPSYATTLQGLPIELNRAVLREDSVSFGGSINITSMLTGIKYVGDQKKAKPASTSEKTNVENADSVKLGAGLNIDDLRFGINGDGTISLKGIAADGSVGIPSKLTSTVIPGLDLGASLAVKIDTFDDWYVGVKTEINFEVVAARGELAFKVLNVNGTPIPIPDKLEVYVENTQPGIPIIPIAPVVYLTGLGGGFEELYDTIAGNFDILPPLTLRAIVSCQIAKILEAKEVTFSISARGMSFVIKEIKIGDLEIFKNVGMGTYIQDTRYNTAMDMKFFGGIDIKDIIVGDVVFTVGFNVAQPGALGPFRMSGEGTAVIKTPDNFPFFGGITFASAELGISDESVHAGTKWLGVPFTTKYVWGAAYPTTTVGSIENMPIRDTGLYSQTDFDKDGKPIALLTIGSNVTVVSDSKQKGMVASLESLGIVALTNKKEHLIDITNNDYTVLEAEYLGEFPEFHLFNPNGIEMPLIEDDPLITEVTSPDKVYYSKRTVDNGLSSSGNKVTFAIISPMDGVWKLTSSIATNLITGKVDAVPVLTSVDSSITESDLSVNWEGDNLEGKKVNIRITTNVDNEPGYELISGVNAMDKKINIKLSDDLQAGDYYVRVQLVSEINEIIGVKGPINPFHYVDPHQPLEIKDLAAMNIGSGILNITWLDQENVDGYIIDAINKETDEIASSFDITENKGDNYIGGSFISTANLETGTRDKVQQGLVPGKTYIIKVIGYNIVNDLKHYSEEVTREVTLRTPNPVQINYAIKGEDSDIVDQGLENNVHKYLSKEEYLELTLSSDQTATYDVIVNDELIYDEISGNDIMSIHLTEDINAIGIKAVNADGDISEEGFSVTLDLEPPVLRIDSPKQGELVSGIVDISGFVDLNSTLIVNGKEVTYDQNGLFEAEMEMGNDMVKILHVEAYDKAGNKSEYLAEIYNDKIEDIQEIKLKPNRNQLEIGEQVDYDVYLVDEIGNEYVVDDSVIQWSVLNSYGVLDVSDDGVVKALMKGKDILIASYQISEDYAFEDAVVIEVVKEIRKTKSIVAKPDYITLKQNEYTSFDVYEVLEDLTNRSLDNELLSFDIVSGLDKITIDDVGKITGLKLGESIVTIIYNKNGGIYEEDVIIKVIGKNDKHESGSLTIEDEAIVEAIKNLRNYQGIVVDMSDYPGIEEDGRTKIVLSLEALVKIWGQANSDNGPIRAIFRMPTIKDTSGYIIEIPSEALKVISGNVIQIETGIGSILMPCNMLLEEYDLKGNIRMVIDIGDKKLLSQSVRNQTGDRPFIDIRLEQDGIDLHWMNDKSPVQILIPYELKSDEDVTRIIVLYVDNQGNATKVEGGEFEEESNLVIFNTSHLSSYGIAYETKVFNDLGNHLWAQEAIEALALKGITKGTSETTFSPATNITRADFITLVNRCFEFTGMSQNEFSDVKPGMYYTQAIATANDLGVVVGVGDNKFMPLDTITRQDMIVILERALKVSGENKKLETSQLLYTSFDDHEDVSGYAIESVQYMISTGIIKGSNNYINPKNKTTRAEVAQVLYNLLKKIQ